MRCFFELIDNDRGTVLIAALLIFTMLALTAIYTAFQTTTEMRIASNRKLAVEAFYIAEAGIEESRVRLPSLIPSTTPPNTRWRVFIGNATDVANLFPDDPYDPSNPDHLLLSSQQNQIRYAVRIRHKTEEDYGSDLNGDGDQDDVVLWGDGNGDGDYEQNADVGIPIEMVTSVGIVKNAISRIAAELKRNPVDLKYAVWGNVGVEIKENTIIWKGSSSEPYVASVGSNVQVTINQDVQIFGDVDIGRDENGTQGACVQKGGSSIYGTGPNHISRLDPDPLGAFETGSELEKAFITASSTNDNLTAGIIGDVIDLGGGESMTLGAGNYFLSSITLHTSSSLLIDVLSGPVNIYLTGKLEAKNGSVISITPSEALPDKFTIYNNADDSNSSSISIDLGNSSDFTGIIYAPKANMNVHNSGIVTGMIWGNKVFINNNGQVVYDPRIKHRFLLPTYSLHAWREESD